MGYTANKQGGANGYTQFEDDGTAVFQGNATVWDDLGPSSVTVNTSGPNVPAFTAYNGGLRALEFVSTGVQLKELNMGFQLPHSYKEGSDIVPHLHLFIPNDVTGGVIKFFIEKTWANVDSLGSIATVTTSATLTVTANQGVQNNAKFPFPTETGTGKTISSIYMCRIYRDPSDAGDTFGSSVWLKAADIHYEKDTVGSRTITTK